MQRFARLICSVMTPPEPRQNAGAMPVQCIAFQMWQKLQEYISHKRRRESRMRKARTIWMTDSFLVDGKKTEKHPAYFCGNETKGASTKFQEHTETIAVCQNCWALFVSKDLPLGSGDGVGVYLLSFVPMNGLQ